MQTAMRARFRRRDFGRFAAGAGLAAAVLPMGTRTVRAQQHAPAFPRSVAELVQVAPDAYMYRNVRHNGFFVVTEEGVIAVDPIGLANPNATIHYKSSIESVTGQPVRYVVYGFDHQDHAAGGSIFADTAAFVSHRLAAPKIAGREDPRTPEPRSWSMTTPSSAWAAPRFNCTMPA